MESKKSGVWLGRSGKEVRDFSGDSCKCSKMTAKLPEYPHFTHKKAATQTDTFVSIRVAVMALIAGFDTMQGANFMRKAPRIGKTQKKPVGFICIKNGKKVDTACRSLVE